MENNVRLKSVKEANNTKQKCDSVINKPILTKFNTSNIKLYRQSIDLRNTVLRGPLKKLITPEEMTIEQNNQFYGITIAEVLVATFSIYQKDVNTIRLVSFAVSTQYQQQGLGTRLLRWALNDFRKQGYQQVSLSARSSAHEFYLKQGFKDIGQQVVNHYLNVVDVEMQYNISTQH